jgi:predicted enzyme related to lactoylglutathione lyase
MPERSYPPGTFCWFEMVASDQSVARTFYTTLFGWTPLEIPVPGEGTYTALKLGDDVVAGLFGIDDEMRSQGVLPHWLSYVSVADVDAAAARLAELGGRVVAGPVDANGQGRMVVAEDPMGAALGLWQPKAFAGSQRFREPGSPSWTELMTRDEGAALEFYRGLFGWATRVAPGAAGQSYTHFLASGIPVAGMLVIREEWGEVPPNWSLYFAVEDLDATLGLARRLGASVEMEPLHVPGVARFCLVRDPQGAHFEVMETDSDR